MNLKARFKEKLSKLLFLEINKERIYNIFNINVNESIYFPVKSSNIIKNVKNGEEIEKIPISYFIEGMFYVLGGDKNFIYNPTYIKILQSNEEYIKFIKGTIYNEIKNNNYEESYILLKGLTVIEGNKENYDKLLLLVNDLKVKNIEFQDEQLGIIMEAKKIEHYSLPFLYEALIYRDIGKYDKALLALNEYIRLKGEITSEIEKFKLELNKINDFEVAKNLVEKDPDKALKLLIPLIDGFSEKYKIYYYIALAYRNLQNYEKAIFYLNEVLSIQSDLIEVVNELGLNYACIGDFEKAVQYFRKVFEVTKSVEVCTNLIMCYLNLEDMEQAKLHLKIAEKLDANDEIVIQLKRIINK